MRNENLRPNLTVTFIQTRRVHEHGKDHWGKHRCAYQPETQTERDYGPSDTM